MGVGDAKRRGRRDVLERCRRRHESLLVRADALEKRALPVGVELGEHIVEQENRRLSRPRGDDRVFGDFKREDRGAALTLRAEGRDRLTFQPQLDVVAMRADERRPSLALTRTRLGERLGEASSSSVSVMPPPVPFAGR